MLNAATKKTVAAHLKDRHGNDIYYGNGGDTWFTPSMHIKDYREHLKKIRHMELRDDDVILASFPRSGTLWHHQILYMLLHNTTDYVGRMEQDHLEWTEFEKLSRPEGPQTYVTHLRYHHLPVPQQAREQKVKVIYCYRNPKDCWVSLYNIARGIQIIPSYEGTWSHFFDLMIDTGYWYGDWFDHVLEWEKAKSDHPDDIFLSCYELMKRVKTVML